jgi:aspartate kinase
MKVLKFGGTSVRDSRWINKALDITESQMEAGLVVVSSAIGDTTNRLQDVADLAKSGKASEAGDGIMKLRASHVSIARELLEDDGYRSCEERLDALFKELGTIVTGLALLKECTPRSNDLILSFGERLATSVLHSRALERGIASIHHDARQLIKTTDDFGFASPLEKVTNRLIRNRIKTDSRRIHITQGFIGSTVEGMTTTLGRNRSDYSAIVIGAALDAEEVQIWTDVDGIMTTDPRIVPQAQTIPTISYREAAELAYFGAKVIHPTAIQPAVAMGIPIWVRGTGQPEGKGTRIVADIPAEGPKAVACKESVTVINITSGRMLMAYGFLRGIFEIFERYKTPVDLIATSEVSVSMTIDDAEYLTEIENDLTRLGRVVTDRDQSIICLVGQDLWKNSSIIARVFGTLQPIPIRMISLGSSDTNLSIVVPKENTEECLRSLHREFFES